MLQYKAHILKHAPVGPDSYRLLLRAPRIARSIQPGQFLHVRCAEAVEPLLRRPFSVHRIASGKSGGRPGSIEIMYKIVGRGTEILSHKKSGGSVNIIGPLGNGFDYKAMVENKNAAALLIAGGMGVAPMVALAEAVARRSDARIYVFLGACSKQHILCESDFKKVNAKVSVITEDGSKGAKGLAGDILERFLRRRKSREHTVIYACGPTPMLKAIAKIADYYDIPCQVSMEENMACGIGACLGCPVKTHSKEIYKMVCKDGPVFDARHIKWD